MARDFVPCLYTERELPNAEDYGWTKRCEVIECFVGARIATHESLWIMTTDSHAYFMDTGEDDTRVRDHLFAVFYAAMAALE
jgi:hypothetical protein